MGLIAAIRNEHKCQWLLRQKPRWKATRFVVSKLWADQWRSMRLKLTLILDSRLCQGSKQGLGWT